MPAKLVVTTAGGDQREVWVEDSVLRIGRDPQCDVEIVDDQAPPHAATIEFQDGRYVLYNRAGAPVWVADRELPAGGKSGWPANTDLVLSSGSRVRLEVQGNPAPSPAPRLIDPALEAPAPAEEEEAAAKPAGGGSAVVQLSVIAFCFGASALLFAWSFLRSSEPEGKKPRSKYSYQQIHEATARPNYVGQARDDPDFAAALTDLREGRILDLRNEGRAARERYLRVASRLGHRKPPGGDFATMLEGAMYNFALDRIDAIDAGLGGASSP